RRFAPAAAVLRSTPRALLVGSCCCSRLVVIRSCSTVIISRNTRLVSVDRGLRNIALVREVILLNLSACWVLAILGRLAEAHAGREHLEVKLLGILDLRHSDRAAQAGELALANVLSLCIFMLKIVVIEKL